MSRNPQIERLGQIADLLFDSRLAVLQAAARAKLETETQLAALMTPPAEATQVSEIASALAGLSYQRWADARRADLNMRLARQTVAWAEARDSAREAFGKKQALGGVAAKLAAMKPRDD